MEKNKPKRIFGFVLGFVLSFALIFVFDSDQAVLPAPNSAVPQNALPAAIVIALLATLLFVAGIKQRKAANKQAEAETRPKLRRSPDHIGSRLLGFQFFCCMILILLFNHGGWSLETVGFKNEVPLALSLGCGFFVYLLFMSLLDICIQASGKYDEILVNNLITNVSLWPRQHSDRKKFMFAAWLLNPVTEELMFRGILVYQFALAIESHTLPIALGLAVTMGNHAYQGWGAMTTHVPFYFIVLGLIYSPLGLAGAIGFHVAGDILPFVWMKTNLRHYQNLYRKTDPTISR